MSQFKNQREVLEALFAGKKVRRIYDHEDEYIFMNDNGNVCDEDGTETSRIVYYREAEIYTPPKKKITKTIERWINVYPDGVTLKRVYESEGDALRGATDGSICRVKLTGTYEVEE